MISKPFTPCPKPVKRDRLNEARKRLIKQLDRKFQQLPEYATCATPSACCKGSLMKHHVVRRRHISLRYDDSNVLILCYYHHSQLHQVGEQTFLELHKLTSDTFCQPTRLKP